MYTNEPTPIKLNVSNGSAIPAVNAGVPRPGITIRRVDRKDFPDVVGIDAKSSAFPWTLERFWGKYWENGKDGYMGVTENAAGEVCGFFSGYKMGGVLHIERMIATEMYGKAFALILNYLTNGAVAEMFHAIVVTVNEFDVALQLRLRDAGFATFHTWKCPHGQDYYQFIFRPVPIAKRMANSNPV